MKSGAWLLRDYLLSGYPKICLMLCEGSAFLTTLGRILACQFSMQCCQISEWLLQLHWAVCEASHLPLLTNTLSESREGGASTRQGSGTIARHNKGVKKDKPAHSPHTLCFVESWHSLFRKKKVSFNTPLSWCSHIWGSVAAWPDHQFKDSVEVTFLDIILSKRRKRNLFLYQMEGKIDQPLGLVYYKMWYSLLRAAKISSALSPLIYL